LLKIELLGGDNILISYFVLTDDLLVPRIALILEVPHVNLGVYNPELHRHFVDEFFDDRVIFAEARVVHWIDAFIYFEDDAMTDHSTSLIIHCQILFFQFWTKYIKGVVIIDPSVVKGTARIVIAKIIPLTSSYCVILPEIHLFGVPVLLHLQVSHVDVLVDLG
jgi:hypothetical protein